MVMIIIIKILRCKGNRKHHQDDMTEDGGGDLFGKGKGGGLLVE